MQRQINAEQSGLSDVLAHVAYALPRFTGDERAYCAHLAIQVEFDSSQQAFLAFVAARSYPRWVDELE